MRTFEHSTKRLVKGEKNHKPGCCDKNIFGAILALFAF